MTTKRQKADKATTTKNQTRHKLNKRPWFVALFILLNVAVILATAVAEFGNATNAEELAKVHINAWYLLPAVACFVVALVFEIYKYVLMIRRMDDEKTKLETRRVWKIARRTVLLGKYYDNITPAAVGGQPFQIYYMRKNSKLPAGAATAIPVFGMVAGQIGFLIVALACLILGGKILESATLIGAACIGLLVFAFWPVVVILAIWFPKKLAKLINWFVKIFAKMHIVKNQQELSAKIEHEVQEYAKSVKRILKEPGLFTLTILCSVIYNALIIAIPYFVLTAFGGAVNFWPCFVTTMAVMAAVYFVPTPGNSGAAEGTFFVVFSALSSGYVFWAMLVWRFFSYYIYILTGPIIYAIIHLEGKKKKHV